MNIGHKSNEELRALQQDTIISLKEERELLRKQVDKISDLILLDFNITMEMKRRY